MKDFQLLDVVALVGDRHDDGLVSGQVGVIVEVLDDGVFEVEFCDNEGRPYALLPVCAERLMVLRYSPVAA